VERDQSTVKCRVKVKLSSDLEQWKRLYQALTPLLGQISSNRISFLVRRNLDRPEIFELHAPRGEQDFRPRQWERVVMLFRGIAPSGTTYWDGFVVPEPVARVLEEYRLHKYSLCIALVDPDGKVLHRVLHVIENCSIIRGEGRYRFSPFWWVGTGELRAGILAGWPFSSVEGGLRGSELLDETLAIGLDKLGNVAGVKASFKEGRAK
jgi:hypothetical protein